MDELVPKKGRPSKIGEIDRELVWKLACMQCTLREIADVIYDGISFGSPDYIVDTETILTSYPLTNIK